MERLLGLLPLLVLVLGLAQPAQAVTRLYLPSAGTSPLTTTPTFAAWGLTTGADRLRTTTRKAVTASTSKASAAVGVTTTRDVLVRQYLSDPLSGAQTVAGTAKGVIRTLESLATANAQAQMTIRVVSKDGSTVRGTSLALSTAGATSEFVLALTNRKFPVGWASPIALSSVSAQDGDRICIEIGARFIATTVATTTATLNFGDAVATDLAENETATTALNPWIELSQTLTFQAVPELRAVGTYLAGAAGTTAVLAVPTGVATNDIVLAFFYKENAAVVTPPDGTWTSFVSVATTDHTLHGFWRRATGADSGTYTFTWTGSAWREGCALAYSNCVTSGNPYEALSTNFNNTAATTSPAVSLTPLTDNSRLIWISTSFAGGNPWTVPTNFARRQTAAGLSDCIVADRVINGLTATGSVTGTASGSGRMTAALFGLKPAAAGGGFNPATGSTLLVF